VIVHAMENPLDCAPLPDQIRPGNKVVLMTGDRFTDGMLGRWHGFGFKFLDYLNWLGVRDEDVTLVYAPGSHPTPAWRERLGPALLQRVRAIWMPSRVATSSNRAPNPWPVPWSAAKSTCAQSRSSTPPAACWNGAKFSSSATASPPHGHRPGLCLLHEQF